MDHHGLPFFVDTLVQAAKHFDKCLAAEHLTRFGLLHMRPYKRVSTIPRLFKGLFLRVFHIDGVLRSDPDVDAIGLLRQLMLIGKNFRIACPNSRTYESVQEFFQTDSEIREPSLDWDNRDLNTDSTSNLHFGDIRLSELSECVDIESTQTDAPSHPEHDCYDAVQRTADIAVSFFGRFNPSEWRARHGPGAVSDRRQESGYKYHFPSWPERLEGSFPFADLGFANYGDWADSIKHESWCDNLSVEEPASKLISVPKTYRSPRLIASEPTSHQWCQQILRDYLMRRVKRTPLSASICFDDQTVNGRLALSASHTGSHATIDLSSASDRISCWLIERLFRSSPDTLRHFHACRTRVINQTLDLKAPATYRLRKFSTMGSAITFPIQSILFSVIAIGCLLYEDKLPVTIRNVSRAAKEVQVFGDDIIVPLRSWVTTQDVLQALGLRVNTDKTFGTGKFRESCGVDAYDGVNVTKVNVLALPEKSKPANILSLIDSHNNLFLKGLWNTADFVRRAVASIKGYPIMEVVPFSGAIGWFVFGDPDNSHLRVRRNPHLHRRECLALGVSTPSTKVCPDSNSMMLQYFTETNSDAFIEGDRLGYSPLRGSPKLRRSWVPWN
ncbi:MAG: putative replicase protein [Alehxovirus pseudofaecenecus]|uniref:RNA-directed RNA polymerase n=1 Tax=Leviviridae sp. TaxID=2027243 RepID=A0ABY3SSJ2_9VIRU|nr:MAG: putative replicase protein [Leviviridae sp.]